MPNFPSEEVTVDDAGKKRPIANKAGTGLAILDDSVLRRVKIFKDKGSPYYLWNPNAREAFLRSFPTEGLDPPLQPLPGNPPLPIPKPGDWTDLPWYFEIFNH